MFNICSYAVVQMRQVYWANLRSAMIAERRKLGLAGVQIRTSPPSVYTNVGLNFNRWLSSSYLQLFEPLI